MVRDMTGGPARRRTSASFGSFLYLPFICVLLYPTGVQVRGTWVVQQLEPHTTDNVTRLTLRLSDALGVNAPANVTSFTLCLWFKVTTFRDLSCLLSYALSAESDDVIRIFVRPGGVEINYNKVNIQHNMPIRPLWWYPTCVVVHPGVVSVLVAGEEQQQRREVPPLALYGSLVLGQEQDDLDGGFISNQAFVGHVTGLTFWNNNLSSYQLQAWSDCKAVGGPEAHLSWDEIVWTIHNDTGSVKSHFDGPCHKNETSEKNLILFTNKMSWPKARQFLQLAGLSMAGSDGKQERHQVTNLILKYKTECTNAYSEGVHVWLGTFMNERNNTSGDETQINIKEETRMREYAVSQDERGNLRKENPSEELCFIGLYTKMPQEFRLQGLCGSESSSTMSFIISPTLPDDQGNSVYLHGYGEYRIVRDYPMSRWCLEHNVERGVAETSVLACTTAKDPPLGRRYWSVHNKTCRTKPRNPVVLALSTCASDHFTCPDSSCIHLSKLCDNVLDCHDGTDERNCFTCVKLPGYVQAIPPHVPVQLLVKVMINRIGSTDLLASALSLDTTLNVAWTDHRLEFRHLHNTSGGAFTAVILEDNSKVWTPAFKVEGGSLAQREVEDGLQVQKKTDGTVVDGAYIAYNGAENPLLLKLDLNIVSYCHFHLTKYPWDVQECHVELRVRKLLSFQVEMLEGSQVVSCPKRLMEYEMYACELSPVSGGFVLRLVMARRSEFHIWTTYLPTTLLLGIGYGTLFLPVDRFPERGGMGLTTLLVFISLYTDVSSSLPSTAHLKLIDVWFVYNILFLSLIIGTHLLACGSIQGTGARQWVVPEKEKGAIASNSREEFILKVARITFGLVTLLFLVGYFVSTVY